MSVHLDYAAENFREAWTHASDDPTTVEALTRGGRALVHVARELEEAASRLDRLRREVEQLRAERNATAPQRALLVVRDSDRTAPVAVADDGVEIVEIDLHAVGGREGFARLPAHERTAWLAATDAQIAAMPEGRAQAAAARLWRELTLARAEADDTTPTAQRDLPARPAGDHAAGR